MPLFDGSFFLLLAGLLLVVGGAIFLWQEGQGVIRLWLSIDAKQFEHRKGENVSPQENQAIDSVLEMCSHHRRKIFSGNEELRFVPDTLRLISQIAVIYYPNEKRPMEKARIGNVLAAFQEMNQKLLTFLELPDLEKLTQFRLRNMLLEPEANKKNKSRSFMPEFLMRRIRLMIFRVLWVQWTLMIGEAAIKVYGEHRDDEIADPESLLDEMDQLQDQAEFPLPDKVREIVDVSRKKILFSLKPLPWLEAKSLYISLAENIARVGHPESSAPLYEVRIYDLLRSAAGYLEWAGQLSQKPVLNKMLGLRLSHLTGAREVTIPFTDNKLFDWAKKYQVGRAAKWSKTILKTLQKKQPGILFRDVVMGVVMEGGKRWLILILHDKIANETSKLYKVSPDC